MKREDALSIEMSYVDTSRRLTTERSTVTTSCFGERTIKGTLGCKLYYKHDGSFSVEMRKPLYTRVLDFNSDDLQHLKILGARLDIVDPRTGESLQFFEQQASSHPTDPKAHCSDMSDVLKAANPDHIVSF